MCGPALPAVAIGLTAAAGGVSAYNQYQQGAAEKKYYNSLADRTIQEGQDALKLAEMQSTAVQNTQKESGKRLAKDQQKFNASTRAQLSAQGVSGAMAEDLITGNFNMEKMDELILRNNADLKSWEINTQGINQNLNAINRAEDYRYAGKQAKKAGNIGAFTTLLGTASSVAGMGSSLYSTRKPKNDPIGNTGYYPGRM